MPDTADGIEIEDEKLIADIEALAAKLEVDVESAILAVVQCKPAEISVPEEYHSSPTESAT